MKLGYEKTKTLVLHYSSKGKSKNSRLGCKICIFSSRRERRIFVATNSSPLFCGNRQKSHFIDSKLEKKKANNRVGF